jgi:hypothetical protein
VDTGGGTARTEPVSVKVDCSAPSVSVSTGGGARPAGSALAPVLNVRDAASGVASTAVELSVDGRGWGASTAEVTVEEGRTYRFRARATDVAGNVSGWTYSPVVEGVAPAAGDESGGGANPPLPYVPPPIDDVRDETGGRPMATPAPAQAAVEPRAVSPAPFEAPVGRLAAAAADPRLRVLRARARRRSLAIAGSVALGFDGRGVTVRVTVAGRTVTRRAAVRRGRWSITVPSRRRAAALVVVTTKGTENYRPGRVALPARLA